MGGIRSTRISHRIIQSLHTILTWYNRNRGVGRAGVVLSYFNMWRELHALTVNISEEGWEALAELARQLNLRLANREEEWMFLFAIETYLHLFSRALALSKLGQLPSNIREFIDKIRSLRSIFAPSIFEWIFEAYSDPSLPIRNDFEANINVMLKVLYNLNTTTLTTDVFRELYQNILPKEVRRSLGEFYTREDVVDEVLAAAGLDNINVQVLYDRWRRSKEARSRTIPIIFDPACGSGSFLLRVIDRAFEALGCRPDITGFLEDVLVGIDINPFAVELARLNLVLKLTDLMNIKCKATYTPTRVKIFWGDSLAKARTNVNVLAQPVMSISLPALAPIIGNETIKIPILKGIDSGTLIDIAYEHAKAGRSLQAFLDEVSERDSSAVNLRNELINLYNIVTNIYQAGNERIVELLKNTIAISSLVGMCDYVIGNPPWVRIHRVARHVMNFLRQSYKYFGRDSAYKPNFKKTETPFAEQHDYSIAFVERGLEFLREGGVLSFVITSKITKSMYAGALREDLVTNCKILEIRDYSLYPVPLFQDAVNYPLVISVEKKRPGEHHHVKVTVTNTVGDRKSFTIPQDELPLDKKDKKSPWLLAPPKVVQAYRKIASGSVRLGDIYEVHMGIKTSADKIFVGKIKGVDCTGGLALVGFGSGATQYIELSLLHPFVRGRGVDPFSYSYDEYIVFTHDSSDFEPLWNLDQRTVLESLGLLNQEVKVHSAGSAVMYVIRANGTRDAQNTLRRLANNLNTLQSKGYEVKKVTPCAVRECYEVSRDGSRVLEVRFDVQEARCIIYVEGLRIPGAPQATRYFLNPDNLDRLLRRDDYRANLPSWAIFRVSKDKFRDYRIAWQEIALHFEACILPVRSSMKLCEDEQVKLLVPDVTVYFIVEPDRMKASKLLLYLNSDLARSLLKLRAWSARGGYFRHQSTSVGALPIPAQLLQCSLWGWIKERVEGIEHRELNEALREIYREYQEKLVDELVKTLKLSEDEYSSIVEWGRWLNELSTSGEEPEEVEEDIEA